MSRTATGSIGAVIGPCLDPDRAGHVGSDESPERGQRGAVVTWSGMQLGTTGGSVTQTEAGGATFERHPRAPGRWSRLHLPDRRLVLLFAVPTICYALITLALQRLGITGWDTPAHLYKMALVGQPSAFFWDNNWYGGAYDLISYGFTFYFAAKLVGYEALVVLSAGALPLLYFLYMRRIYGRCSYVGAIGLAVVLAAYLANGQDPFLFAMALMLGGMVLVAYRHPIVAVVPIAASLFANPLAFLVGTIFLLADFIATPSRRSYYLRVLLYLAPALAARALVSVVFYEHASYVYSFAFVLLCAGWGITGFLMTRLSRDPQRYAQGVLFLTSVAVGLAIYCVPGNAIGSNVMRFFFLFGFPLYWETVHHSLLPKVALLLLLGASFFGQTIPPLSHYFRLAAEPSAKASFFYPALSFAANHYDPDYRLHVVALADHWEAYYFSVNGFPITRGWYRQADAEHNQVLSQRGFSAAAYVRWLRDMGVDYVFLPHAPLDWNGGRERGILRTSSAFTTVWTGRDWTVYRLHRPSPLAVSMDGGKDPDVVKVLHQSIYLRVPAPGRYLVKVTYSPYWQVTSGVGRLRRAPGSSSFLELDAQGAGLYAVQVRVTLEKSLSQLVRIF